MALIDPEFAKRQLILLLREWYMHPNGQFPAYEWDFGDVNPPVHAWAAWRVYQIDREQRGNGDTDFLEEIFHKLMLNFTWWVNRKDADGRNVFQGGFLGLDNIGVFDRSAPLPDGGHLEQADGTTWMAHVLPQHAGDGPGTGPHHDRSTRTWRPSSSSISSTSPMPSIDMGGAEVSLWDEEDGFFYDVLHTAGRPTSCPSGCAPSSGLIPLFAVETLEPREAGALAALPAPRWSGSLSIGPIWRQHRLADRRVGAHGHYQLAILDRDKLSSRPARAPRPGEFLSDYGLRSLSRYHADIPSTAGRRADLSACSTSRPNRDSALFGGNSNWRGPIWFPINYLMIEALRKYHHHYGD